MYLLEENLAECPLSERAIRGTKMIKDIIKIEKKHQEYLIFGSEGMLLSLEPEEYEIFNKYYKDKKINLEHREFFAKLVDYGLLEFEDYKSKNNSVKKEYDLSLMNHNSSNPLYNAPVLAHLSITNKCNMACVYCSVRGIHKFDSKELSTEEWKTIISKLAKWGVFQIGFTGGEPTLRKDLPELIEFTRKQGCVCNLTTNGWFLDEILVDKLVGAGITQCQVSMDSHILRVHEKLRGSGSFKRVVKAIKILQKKGIQVGIDCVVSKNNIKTIPGFIKWITKNKIPFLTIIKLKKGDLSIKDYKKLAPNYKEYSDLIKKVCSRKENKNPNITLDCGSVSNLQQVASKEKFNGIPVAGCPLGHHLICSTPNGDIYPCAALLSSEFKLGNFLEDDLDKLWKENKLLKEFRLIKRNIYGKCKNCERLDFCRGGCRGIVYSFLNNLNDSDPTCKFKIQEVKNENKSR